MAFEVIVMTDDEGMTKIQPECIEAWADDMGVEVIGVSGLPHTRPELHGHPVLSGFVGPCWGGLTEQGEPILRYEDRASYRSLSI